MHAGPRPAQTLKHITPASAKHFHESFRGERALGRKPVAALLHLVRMGVLDGRRVVEGFPHPSGENGERVAYFLERKARSTLSTKTPPAPIDAAREALRAQLARLAA